MNKKLTDWDLRYIEKAKDVSKWSKDKSTKTGAVIVNEDNIEIVYGYNKFPEGVDDKVDQRRYEKPEKYVWTEHAERNAIYKAARLGVSVNGCKMYATYFPCAECSRAIIESGITKLYTEKPNFNHETWGESWVNGMIMLKESGVKVIWTNEPTKWFAQHLLDENMWYLTEHGDNGILGEHFFDSEDEFNAYVNTNEINGIEWEYKCTMCKDKGEYWKDSGHPTHNKSYKVDCKCKEKNECGFNLAWRGPCKEQGIDGGSCEEHSKIKCCQCGGQATRECDATMGLVCGAPLCGTCNHKHSSYL